MAAQILDEYNAGEGIFSGRRMQDAPEIDNEVIVKGEKDTEYLVGTFQEVEILDASEYEIYSKLVPTQKKELPS